MYSRKFGLRLQGKFGNLLKTRGLPGCHGLGVVAAATRFGESGELRPEDERRFSTTHRRRQSPIAAVVRDPLGIPQRFLAARALTCSIRQTTLCHACSRV